MEELLLSFFASDPFIPHGHCYLWKSDLVALHIISDFLTAVAYYSIPITLVYFVRKRRDLPFEWILLLFGAFIILCGTTHLMEVWTLWHPTYWLSGLLKAVTAGVSVWTAIALYPLIPKALALPSPAQLEAEITERKRIEEELRDSQQMLQLVMDNIPQLIFWKDRHSIFLGCNAAFAKVAGIDNPKALVGKTDVELPWKPEETECFRQYEARVMEMDAPEYQIVEPIIKADGQQAWYETNKIPLHDREGKVVGILCTVEDISDRQHYEQALKKAKDELEESYNLVRAVIDGTPDPIFVKDIQGRHLIINDAGACALGKTVEEIVGKDDIELFPPEVARQLMKNDRHVITTGVTAIFEELIYRADAIEGDRRTYLSTKSVYRDTEGNIIGLVGIARDITLAKEARAALEQAKEKLEIRIEERTVELKQAIEQLQGEIADRQRVQEALRSANQTLQTLILASPLAIATLNIDGNVTIWNPAAERLFGWSESEVLGNPLPLVPPDKQEEFGALFQAQLQGEENTGLELRRHRKDGSFIDVSLWTSLVLDSNGAVVSIMALFADISDRVRAERALRENQQQLQDILDNSPSVIYLKDTDGRFIFVNRRFETLFHFDRKTIKGKTEYDIFPKQMADVFRANDMEVLKNRTPLEIEETALQDDGIHSYISIKFPLYDLAGVPYAICGISTDITERKAAIEALQESQRFNQKIAETTPNILYIYDLIEKCNIYSNRQINETLGYYPEAIQQMGKNVLPSLLHPDDLATCLEHHNRIATSENNGIFEIEYRMRDVGGEWHWFRSREIVFAKTERGKPKQILGSAEDISDRKRAEEELSQSLKELSAIKLALERTAIVAITDGQGKITYVNNKFCEVSKYSREELLGQNHRLIKSGYHPKEFFRQMWSTIKSGKVWKGEINNKAKDGTYYWVETTIVPFLEEREKPSQYLAIRYDITDRKRAEEVLLQNEERYRSLIVATSQIVWTTDALGQVIDVPSWRTYTGQTPEQIKGWGWLEAIHPDDRDRTATAWSRAVETKSLYETEYRIRAADGNYRYFSARGVPVLTEEKRIREWVGICTDIHDRKRAEEELRQSEARFRELAQQEELLNRIANQIRNSLELNTILETAVQEIRSLLDVDRCNFTWFQLHAEPPISAIVTEARKPHLPSFLGEYPLDTTDPVTRSAIDLQVIRIDNAQNSTDPLQQDIYRNWGAISLVMLPIHTRFGDVGLFSCVQQSGVRYWSDWEMELLMAVTGQLAIALDQAELYKQSRLAAATSETKARELEQTLGELKQTQAQLIQSEKMSSLGLLVAGVAHEINNPVNFIYGNITPAKDYARDLLNLVQLYQEYYPHPPIEIQNEIATLDLDFIKEDLPKILSSMKVGAERIRQIVLSLRNFSRLDESEMKEVDIHEGLDSTLLILQSRLKAKFDRPGIEVIKEYDNLPLVECYAGQLNQVFMNILSNAIDALEEGDRDRAMANGKENTHSPLPTIRIRTEVADKNRVLIRIADNGPGMTEAVCRKLFDPFFTTKSVGSGTGLGLSISYQIVEKHGGQLQCISAPGEGAEFLIEIPIIQAK